MEVSALKHTGAAGLRGPTPLLRIASDERLVALTRRGNQAAFEALVARYQSRLLSFCRHMLGSREDAEDVLQEVFAASFNAMLADDRPINVRPWLYRIARNRSLNHLRRQQPIGVDSMDVHFADNGATTADKVHKREEFRQLVADVQTLPETQRTALLLREIDALSYDQIAEAMETTIPSVKSLLVRARVSLAEAAEARKLSCEEVRLELGEVAEGLRRTSAPVRRHLRTCDRCSTFRTQLKRTNKALAAVFPVGPLLLFKKLFLAQLGTTASAGGATAASGMAASAAAAGGASTLSAGMGAIASKTAAGLAAAAIVTAGAAEVQHASVHHVPRPAVAAAAPLPRPVPQPVVVSSTPQPLAGQASTAAGKPPTRGAGNAKERAAKADQQAAGTAKDTATTTAAGGQPAPPAQPATGGQPAHPMPPTQQGSDTTALPPQAATTDGTGGTTAPAEPPVPGSQQPQPQPAPDQQPQQQPAPAEQQQQPAPEQQQPAPEQQPAPPAEQQPPPSDTGAGAGQYQPAP